MNTKHTTHYDKKLTSAYKTDAIIRKPSHTLKKHLVKFKIGGGENIVFKSSMPWVIPSTLFYSAFDNSQGYEFLEKVFSKNKLSGVTFYENLSLRPYVKGDRTTSKTGFDTWINTANGSSEIPSATHKILSNPDLKKKWIIEDINLTNNISIKKQCTDNIFSQDTLLKKMHELEILRTDDKVDLFEYPTDEAVKKFVQNKDIISIKPSHDLCEYINTVNMICDNIEKKS